MTQEIIEPRPESEIETGRRHRSAMVAALLVFAIILCVRAVYVSLYALPVPFWDQWDAEGASLLIPWENGQLTWAQMFASHNEHRIFWSRVLSLVIYEGSGESWNNQTLAYFSSGILALVAGGVAAVAWRSRAALLPKLGVSLSLLALGTLPFAWENFLAGFQNQFYFMTLWGTFGIAITVYANGASWRLVALFAAMACIFSMAPGVIWVGAMVFIGVLRAWQERRASKGIIAYLLVLTGIMFWGLDLVPVIEGHAFMKPDNTTDLLAAIEVGLSWPWQLASWAMFVLWIPAAVAGMVALQRRLPSRTDQFMLALAIMAVGQAIAIAYSRGKGMLGVPPRYTEVLMFGMVACTWLALRAPSWLSTAPGMAHRFKPAVTGLACLWVVFLCAGLVVRTPNDLADLGNRHQASCAQTYSLRLFLEDGQPDALRKRPIPYPDPDRLAALATDPTLNSALRDLRDESAIDNCAPPPREEIPTFVDESLGGIPVDLTPGSVIKMRYEMPLAARVDGMTLLIGTYAGRADGEMTLEACSDDHCAASAASLKQAEDNQPLPFKFNTPLRLKPGDTIVVTVTTRDATHPVAIWSYAPMPKQAMSIFEGNGLGRAAKSSLFHQ